MKSEHINWPRPPRCLYKFRNFGMNGLHLDILARNEIFFSSPLRFNDPFDCRIPIRYDLASRAEFLRTFEEIAAIENPGLRRNESHRLAKHAFRNKLFKDREATAKLQEEVVNSNLGVFSLSANPSSLLNWAHYGDSHKGFCIGFDTEALNEFCLMRSLKTKLPTVLMKVNYTREYPLVNPYKISNQQRMEYTFLTKSVDWEYEREYRILLPQGANVLLSVPSHALKRVIIGCQASDDDRQALMRVVEKRGNDIQVFVAKTSPDDFRLRFRLAANGN
ncbi:MAG TPA: hypothetical protein DGH68_12305 [Bacteroidetes bacterium]|jgi:hypothetical protein|nr:hypothetical protein [Bacteroidota bacterium]